MIFLSTDCNTSCPSDNQQVCGSNNKTYLNICELEREACQTNLDVVKDYEGECKGNQFQKYMLPKISTIYYVSYLIFSKASISFYLDSPMHLIRQNLNHNSNTTQDDDGKKFPLEIDITEAKHELGFEIFLF